MCVTVCDTVCITEIADEVADEVADAAAKHQKSCDFLLLPFLPSTSFTTFTYAKLLHRVEDLRGTQMHTLS